MTPLPLSQINASFVPAAFSKAISVRHLYRLRKPPSTLVREQSDGLRRPAPPPSQPGFAARSRGELAAVLIAPVIKQVLASTFDDGHRYAGIATDTLLATGVPNNGLLYGPRSPNYRKD